MSEERHQQRQQRLKEQVDARIASAQTSEGSSSYLPATAKAKPPPRSAPPPAPSDTGKKWA